MLLLAYIYRAHRRAHRSQINSPGVYIYIGRIPPAHRFLNETSVLALSRRCSARIQMPSEQCGQRIPSAYLFFVERHFGEAEGVA